MSKLGLGTAQFGLKYGINNSQGKISNEEAFKILKHCAKNGIEFLDTASDYGDSEKILGRCLGKIKSDFKVISKLRNCDLEDVESVFLATLARIGQNSLYGYLIHDFDFFIKNPSIWNTLVKFKQSGHVGKIGFSLYSPTQLKTLYSRKVDFDIVQVPYNVLDQRFESEFKQLKEKKVEIHIRSVFLQGLLFKKLEKLEDFFEPIAQKLTHLQNISRENKISISNLLLGFVHLNRNIDKIIIGVDSLNNLKENLNYPNYLTRIKSIYAELQTLSEKNENMILPINWRTK